MLFQHGVDEQVIYECFRSPSIDGARVYKRICEAQHKDVFEVLQCSNSKQLKTSQNEKTSLWVYNCGQISYMYTYGI